MTLTAMQQVNIKIENRRATAQRDTVQHDEGRYLNTTGLFWALSTD